MRTIDSYVKRWYDELEDGKIYANRCTRCGAVQMPPLPVCNECGCYDLEWFEIDGEGELLTFDDCQVPLWGPELGGVLSGIIKLKEGGTFQGFVLGLDHQQRIDLFDKQFPVKVQAEIQQRDGFKYPAFRISDEVE